MFSDQDNLICAFLYADLSKIWADGGHNHNNPTLSTEGWALKKDQVQSKTENLIGAGKTNFMLSPLCQRAGQMEWDVADTADILQTDQQLKNLIKL